MFYSIYNMFQRRLNKKTPHLKFIHQYTKPPSQEVTWRKHLHLHMATGNIIAQSRSNVEKKYKYKISSSY